MKKLVVVFNSPHLTNRVFEVPDDAIGGILREWHYRMTSLDTSICVPETTGTYYIRSDLIAYLKVQDSENE